MADVVSSGKRSEMMSGIRGKDTKPELLIRHGLFRRGFRFRVHVSKLPGKPDIVLPKYKAVILVNGCFWHWHTCSLFKWPSTRVDFWREKIGETRKHDAESLKTLNMQGWKALIVWECATKGTDKLNFDSLLDETTSWLVSTSGNKEIGGRPNARR